MVEVDRFAFIPSRCVISHPGNSASYSQLDGRWSSAAANKDRHMAHSTYGKTCGWQVKQC